MNKTIKNEDIWTVMDVETIKKYGVFPLDFPNIWLLSGNLNMFESANISICKQQQKKFSA